MARKQNQLNAREIFYIITNGEETERNYFSLLKTYKSVYDVKIIPRNADPKGLVDFAKALVGEANQVWVVFDVDNSYSDGRLVPAINEAERTGVHYAFSNVAFEVWLISHYKQLSKSMTEKQLEDDLNDYIKNTLKKKTKYEKNDEDLLKKHFIPHYKTAINNAKIVYQIKKKAHIERFGDYSRVPIWEWNSATSVFLLVEALKLQL